MGFLYVLNMCEECFQGNFVSLESEEVFNDFKDKLDSKIKQEKIRLLYSFPGYTSPPKYNIFGFGFGGSDSENYCLFQCMYCKQKWRLSEPDHAWRGYFVQEFNDK